MTLMLHQLSKSVRDFIPERPASAEFTQKKRAAKALQGFEHRVLFILNSIANQYQNIVDAESAVDEGEIDPELVRRKLMYILNESGSYYQFKEQLKMTVTDIVREQFNRKSPFATQDEMRQFLNEVYVYLVDQMHVILNKVLSKSRK